MSDTLISVHELKDALGEVAVFDCRFSLADFDAGRDAFLAEHIPSARHLDMEEDLAGPKTGHNGRHPLPDRETFQNRLRSAGVTSDSQIVLYDDNRYAGAARAWWLLRYFGVHHVRILNGGLTAWRAAGFDLESGPGSDAERGNIVLNGAGALPTIDRQALLQALESRDVTLIDAREAPRWAGEAEPIDPVAGRIPGALNLPWQGVTDERGFWLSPDKLRALWRQATAARNPIVYCGSGVTASVLLLARHLAGLPGGTLYPGSWSEWCSHAECPTQRDD